MQEKINSYIIGCDCSSSVPRHQLDLHINSCKQVYLLRLEAGARFLIESQRELLAFLEHLGPAFAPRHDEVPVERAISDHQSLAAVTQNDIFY